MRWRRGINGSPRTGTGAGDDAAPAVADGIHVELDAVVERRIAEWQPRYRGRGIELEAVLEPVTVIGAADHLGTVLDALLSNAHRFCDRGDRVAVMLRADAASATLQVADTGIGIYSDELGYVFERFYRGSLGRERALGGSGLGLSITRDIAEAHGGSVRVESVLGEGSCFTVILPAHRGTEQLEPIGGTAAG